MTDMIFTLFILLSFIAPECCVTRGCCFKIAASDIIDMGMDNYRIRATGEQVGLSGRSPDGAYWRCACDYDEGGRKYTPSVKAKTRCLFVPNNEA